MPLLTIDQCKGEPIPDKKKTEMCSHTKTLKIEDKNRGENIKQRH